MTVIAGALVSKRNSDIGMAKENFWGQGNRPLSQNSGRRDVVEGNVVQNFHFPSRNLKGS